MNARPATFAEAIVHPDFAYARTRFTGGSAFVTAYLRDPSSPTGVLGFWSHPDFDEAVRLMDAAGRPFPLSPTEGLRGS
jgi:hypothetical protein